MMDGRSILVVDDDEDIRDMLRIVLEGEGYPVDTARDGEDAARRLRGYGAPPALIFLDLMMPHMDGEEFLGLMRQSHWRRVPVAVLSGDEAVVRKGSELRADYVLKKPVELSDVLELAHRVVPLPAPPQRAPEPGVARP